MFYSGNSAQFGLVLHVIKSNKTPVWVFLIMFLPENIYVQCRVVVFFFLQQSYVLKEKPLRNLKKM